MASPLRGRRRVEECMRLLTAENESLLGHQGGRSDVDTRGVLGAAIERTEVGTENSILPYRVLKALRAAMSSLKIASLGQGLLNQPCGSATLYALK